MNNQDNQVQVDINLLIDLYKDKVAELESLNIQQRAQIITMQKTINDLKVKQNQPSYDSEVKEVTPKQAYDRSILDDNKLPHPQP